jgi:hypothetical protein
MPVLPPSSWTEIAERARDSDEGEQLVWRQNGERPVMTVDHAWQLAAEGMMVMANLHTAEVGCRRTGGKPRLDRA